MQRDEVEHFAHGRAAVGQDRHVAGSGHLRDGGVGDAVLGHHPAQAQFGGGFRQAGIIAAGALFGLRNNRQRLGEDHLHARLLADRIAPLPGVQLDPATVETNILRFSVTSIKAGELAFRLHDLGLHVLPSGDDGIRMIPHLNHTRKDVEAAAGIVERVMKEIASNR